MIENSSAGLVMVTAEVPVTVTREEHHQHVLARYAVEPGGQRHVAVELGWCVIGSGKHRGEHAVEVRLDGQRVGELTHLMSQRYAPLIAQVTSGGGRVGCEAVVQRGAGGLEVVLRLPRADATAFALPVAPAAVMAQQRRSTFSAHRPAWIAAAVVGVFLVIGVLLGENSPSSTTAALRTDSSTTAPATTSRPTTTRPSTTVPTTTVPTTTVPTTTVPTTTVPTTTVPTTTVPTTTVPRTTAVAPPPAPPAPPVVVPPPVAPPAPVQRPACDPNYTGCVPVASDVDCEGGTGNGPAYVAGPVRVIGSDVYDLDRDGDGDACED
ncbi:hypothetical protein [Umezawaea beigongshangensis]|uniref:hypothetical protein n=1 Tax=Umezawaea beigongshangensis TaxID=2780383 RepID=UPI0018F12324|nr:hypothetical protein [Umezawaea beigongshangensis]